MRRIELRLRAQERRRGWRGWMNVPLDQWPDYAGCSLWAALPGAIDELPDARLDEFLAMLRKEIELQESGIVAGEMETQ